MMEKAHRGVIQFLGYRLIDFQYHCDNNYAVTNGEAIQYSFGFHKKTERPSDQSMLVFLRTNVFIGENEEDAPCSMSLEIVGHFESDISIQPQWEMNALAILFPYVRSIISSFTAQSGMPSVILPTVNIAQMFKDAEKNS